MSTVPSPGGTAEPVGATGTVGALARGIAGKAGPLYLSMLATMAGGMVTAGPSAMPEPRSSRPTPWSSRCSTRC